MHCPLRDIARSIGRFLIAGATNYTTERSLEKQRLAQSLELPHIDIIGTATAQRAGDLQEPLASAVPPSAEIFTYSNAPTAQLATQYPAYNGTFWSGNTISHDRSDSLIVPSWAVVTCFAIGSILWFAAIALSVAYKTQLARAHRQLAAAEARAASAEVRLVKEQTSNTRARKHLDSVKNNLVGIQNSLGSVEKKLASTEGAFDEVVAQYGVAVTQLSDVNHRIKNLKRTAGVLSQESINANAKSAALTEQLSAVNEERQNDAKKFERSRKQLEARLAQVKSGNSSLRQKIKNITAKATTTASKKERRLKTVKIALQEVESTLGRRTAALRKLRSQCLHLEDAHRLSVARLREAEAESREVHSKVLREQKKDADIILARAQATSAELIDNVETLVKAALSDNKRLKFRNAILMQDKSGMIAEIESWKGVQAKTIQAQKLTIADAEKTVAVHKDEISMLNSANGLLYETLTMLAAQQTYFMSEIDDLKQKCTSLKERINELGQKENSLREKLKEAEQQVCHFKDDLQAARTQIKASETELADLESAHEEQLAEAKDSLEAFEVKHNEAVSEHEASVRQLKVSLEYQDQEIKGLRETSESEKATLQKVEAEIREANARVEQAQSRADALEQDNALLQAQLSSKPTGSVWHPVEAKAERLGAEYRNIGSFETSRQTLHSTHGNDVSALRETADDRKSYCQPAQPMTTEPPGTGAQAISSITPAGAGSTWNPKARPFEFPGKVDSISPNHPNVQPLPIAGVESRGEADSDTEELTIGPNDEPQGKKKRKQRGKKRKDGVDGGKFRSDWRKRQSTIDGAWYRKKEVDNGDTMYCWHDPRCLAHQGTNGTCTGEDPHTRGDRIRAGVPRMPAHGLPIGTCWCH
ncbi:hypothetical protein CLAFUW4_01826 [Fulvia fulva]|uniref:Uncharacterized protein n=1 Tax=Passalora fulva TaxID=5499 RepID=A0A9Q8P3T2_PASFU|nr:uncharacterized protein CLAFUR5_01821 [Fulvia fulva]UJO12253.1 hypothetical protein CLAFUR5_01821 [Fulvia fulva]WPV09960.1 hypothetical protein CLAFUW4_01826 [Fulvia fulva]